MNLDKIKNNKYLFRLVKEWLINGCIILGVDFDDTINPHKWWDNKSVKDCQKRLDLIKYAVKLNAKIVCCTSRAKFHYDEIYAYFGSAKIPLHGMNENIDIGTHDLSHYKDSKVFNHLLLDDRAGLEEATKLLKDTLNALDWISSNFPEIKVGSANDETVITHMFYGTEND